MDLRATLLRNTTFLSGQGMEFLLALLNIVALERLTASQDTGEIHMDAAIQAIMADIKGRMSDFLRAELKHFFGSADVSLPIFSFALDTFPLSATPGELIDGFEKQPALPFFQQAQALWERLTGQGGIGENHDTWMMADCHARETKHRLVYLLKTLYEDHYSRHEERIHQSILEMSERMQSAFLNDPINFYSTYLAMDPAAFAGKACIHVSAFLQGSLFILQPQKPGAPTWIAVGGNMEESKRALATQTKQIALRFFKLMGDRTRYEIVQLLMQRPRYNEELANHLEVSPATVNHHLAALLELGIVSMVREQHRMYYSLNQEKLRHLLDRIYNGVFGERGGKAGSV